MRNNRVANISVALTFPGTVLSPVCVLMHAILTRTNKAGPITTVKLQMRKVRHKRLGTLPKATELGVAELEFETSVLILSFYLYSKS